MPNRPDGYADDRSEAWLRGVAQELGVPDLDRSRLALRAVLFALRDRLPSETVRDLARALPARVAGILVEGWTPRRAPPDPPLRSAFLASMRQVLGERTGLGPEEALRAVIAVVEREQPLAWWLPPLKRVLREAPAEAGRIVPGRLG